MHLSQQSHDSLSRSRKESDKVKNIDESDDFSDDNAKIFPQKLMEILADASNTDSISWLPHGKAFVIRNRKTFSSVVLPKYFRKTKYTSFTRKLNRWNFARITKGPEQGSYFHKYFQRDNEFLCTQMYCKNERAKFANSQQEPTESPYASPERKEHQPPQVNTIQSPIITPTPTLPLPFPLSSTTPFIFTSPRTLPYLHSTKYSNMTARSLSAFSANSTSPRSTVLDPTNQRLGGVATDSDSQAASTQTPEQFFQTPLTPAQLITLRKMMRDSKHRATAA